MRYLHFNVKDHWHILFLFALILLYTISNASFISHDRSPLVADSFGHLRNAITSYKTIPDKMGFYDWDHLKYMYPPLLYLCTSLFFKIFGVSIPTAIWSIYPFSIILIITFFAVGNHFGGRFGGIAAALIGAGNCYFINHSHIYFLDVPQASLIGLSFFFLLKSEIFERKLFSYLFGISAGLAMLSRPTSIFFIIGPLLILVIYFACRSLRVFLATMLFGTGIAIIPFLLLRLIRSESITRNIDVAFYLLGFYLSITLLLMLTTLVRTKLMEFFREKNREVAGRLLTGIRVILLFLVIFMPYYISGLQQYRDYYSICRGSIKNLGLPAATYIRWNIQTNVNFIQDFFPIIFLLALIGLIVILIRGKQLWDFALLLSMGISGLVLTSVYGITFVRYLLAEILVFAVLGGYWIEYAGKLKFLIIAFLSSYTILSLAFPLYSPNVPDKWDNIVSPVPNFHGHSSYSRVLSSLSLEPTYPVNPYPDKTKLFRISDDIEKKYRNSLRNKYRTFGIYFLHDEFYICDNWRDVEDFYEPKVKLILLFKGISPAEPHKLWRKRASVEEYLLENKSIPVFLIIGHRYQEYPEHHIQWIKKDLNRKTEKISTYVGIDEIMLDVYVVYPP